MNRNNLFEHIAAADDDLLERSERRRSRRPLWISAVAAALALVLGLGVFLSRNMAVTVQAVSLARYPEAVAFPMDPEDPDYPRQYEAWREAARETRAEPGYADSLTPFFQNSIREFLRGPEGNRVYSPLNTYMALAMLSELTDGETRQELLTVLGSDTVEDLRAQAHTLWNVHYQNDGATESILASSVWLKNGMEYRKETLDRLAETFYASSYVGEMGTPEMDRALREWLDDQTGGLLTEQTGSLHLDPQTLLALATTIRFQARWLEEFRPENTAQGTFHSPQGDVTRDFMHSFDQSHYYWGEGFGAVGLPLSNDAGTMWLILPDEGTTPEALLEGDEIFAFLAQGEHWEDREYLNVNLSLPKFDVSSDLDLGEGLRNLGITRVFDSEQADFSPIVEEPMALSQAKQAVRVSIDEEGVTAVSYTVLAMAGAGRPPEKTVDFTLDRPFLFAVTSGDGLPLFAGIVNNP